MNDQHRPEQTSEESIHEGARPASELRGSGGASAGGGNRHAGRRRHRGEREGQPRRPEHELNLEELRELSDLITAHGFTEFELQKENYHLRISRHSRSPQAANEGAAVTSAPSPSVASSPNASPSIVEQNSSPTAAPPVTSAAQTTETNATPGAATAREELYMITSPIVGTFYRSPSPTAEPFVRAGSHVEHDTVVCIIEAMKLMNEIQAETSGVLEKIYVENGQPVEYGQPLFGIKK